MEPPSKASATESSASSQASTTVEPIDADAFSKEIEEVTNPSTLKLKFTKKVRFLNPGDLILVDS